MNAGKDPVSALGAGVVPVPPGRVRYTLSSGTVCDVKPGKGKDLRLAGRMVPEGSKDPVLYEFALIAVRCQLDGRELTLEDVDELDMHDAAELLAIVRGKVPSDQEKAEAAAKAEAQAAASTDSPSST